MSEERATYGKQLKFKTVTDYILVHQGQATKGSKRLIVEAKDGIEAARLALDALGAMTDGGKITTIMMSVSIDHDNEMGRTQGPAQTCFKHCGGKSTANE